MLAKNRILLRFPRKKIKITLTIGPKFEKYHIKRLKNAEIYQKTSQNQFIIGLKSQKVAGNKERLERKNRLTKMPQKSNGP